jgi:hypothetical protein
MFNWVEVRKFTVTEDHIKLLKKMVVMWDERGPGAPMVNYLQPYMSMCPQCDIPKILSIIPMIQPDGKKKYSDEQLEYMEKTHRETQIALQIFLRVGTMEPGEYEQDGWQNWRKK